MALAILKEAPMKDWCGTIAGVDHWPCSADILNSFLRCLDFQVIGLQAGALWTMIPIPSSYTNYAEVPPGFGFNK